jgi:Fe2+ transport system protein FeoA
MPLSLAKTGTKLHLERLTGETKLQTHLIALGLVPGTVMEVVSSGNAGPRIVAIRTGRLMLAPEIARHIWVR